jgi:hypothetical protein
VAPEVVGGVGESGGKGITMRCEVGTLLRLKPTGYPSHCTLSAWATRRDAVGGFGAGRGHRFTNRRKQGSFALTFVCHWRDKYLVFLRN